MANDFNQHIIDEFRANGGRVGGPFADARLILLTTTGARTGIRHTTPLAYLPDGGQRILVIASAAGSPKHPDWFHNLVANPRVTVEDGAFTYDADATVLDGPERDEVFARAVEADPGWGDYQAATTRTIPVVALTPVTDGPPSGGTWGEILVRVHDGFRRELALIRKEIAGTGPALGAQLRVNCLTVCQGLHNHHTGEDIGLFVALGDRYPELAPTLARLREEHERIAELVAQLREVLGEGTTDATRARVDQLTTELERHLDHEEEHLVPLLDAM
ncbi:nitroreductase/quinone reductase family protein [Prauserella oleivorans]|uniref:Nitroreductase/quinone reductase family protein n=1 Tax=Prauserella oleivorans TaxID=1478153 RepID=A0ABW5W5Y5_9PSEU